MAATIVRKLLPDACAAASTVFRTKTTSAQYVASRHRDATFEKLMDKYKNLYRIVSIQDLILSSTAEPPSVSIDFLQRISQKHLHLNRSVTAFLRRYPHIFHIFNNPMKLQPFCTLTPGAFQLVRLESDFINESLPLAVTRLVKLLSMSITKTLPLRAIFKVWRELGFPDDFEHSIISRNSNLFSLEEGNEVNTHVLKLNAHKLLDECLVPAVENWRVVECCHEDCHVDRTELTYSFKHNFPPGMQLKKAFKARVKVWQKVPYIGPYEEVGLKDMQKWTTKSGRMPMEKRAVGIVHEFLSLTVEKMVEVEKISHFRKWFGIDLNVRDLFLDHPGMFYLSTKGNRHTVFMREAYERGRLIELNPVYDARRKLLDLISFGRHGWDESSCKSSATELE